MPTPPPSRKIAAASTTKPTDVTNEPPPPMGQLQPIAARVLMKILYGARMARFDLLRAVS
eukprot:5569412-Prorocentrum_lima.AAC.1